MSTIWTPSGEHVPREEPTEPSGTGPPTAPPGPEAGAGPTPDELAALAEVRGRLRSTPAADVVANHAVALFELALVYLGVGGPGEDERPPRPELEQAQLSIDAMAALVEGLAGRLATHEEALREGLARIRMLFVEIAEAVAGGSGGSPGGSDTGSGTAGA